MTNSSTEERCDDCGTRPRWKWAELLGAYPAYCRRDTRKGGDITWFKVDPDKLEKLVGFEMAVKILKECEYNYED